MTASSYLPVDIEIQSNYNELFVDIHRCSNLDNLLSESIFCNRLAF